MKSLASLAVASAQLKLSQLKSLASQAASQLKSQAASQETCAQATQATHVHRQDHRQHVSSGTSKITSKPRITGKIFSGRR